MCNQFTNIPKYWGQTTNTEVGPFSSSSTHTDKSDMATNQSSKQTPSLMAMFKTTQYQNPKTLPNNTKHTYLTIQKTLTVCRT